MNESQWDKLVSIGKGALVAGAGAALAFALAEAGKAAGAGDLGPWGFALVALLSVLVNAFRKFVLPEAAEVKVTPAKDDRPGPGAGGGDVDYCDDDVLPFAG